MVCAKYVGVLMIAHVSMIMVFLVRGWMKHTLYVRLAFEYL